MECPRDSHPCWGGSPTWEQGSVLPVLRLKAVASCCVHANSLPQHLAPPLRMKPLFLLLLFLEQGREFIYISNSWQSYLTAFYSLLLCHRDEITLRTQFNPCWSNLTTSPNKDCSGNKKSKESQTHMLLQPQAWTMNTPLGISKKEKKEVLLTASELQLPCQK